VPTKKRAWLPRFSVGYLRDLLGNEEMIIDQQNIGTTENPAHRTTRLPAAVHLRTGYKE
jgi:hypothetical protein